MSGDNSSADVVPLRTGAEDPTFVYDDVDEEVARRDLPAETSTEEPKQLSRYLILQEIGRGGMGIVYTAYDPKLDRKVALKLIKKQAAAGTRKAVTRRARLVREAQALAKLNHPNIVTVHDVDTHEDQLYMAMEYFEGETLIGWVNREKRTWREIVEAFDQAGEGLAAAHKAGITHRDFKPTNALIDKEGRVKVLDFGLAKSLSHDDSLDNASVDPEDEVSEPEHDAPVPRVRPPSDPIRRNLSENSDIMEFVGSAGGLQLTQAGRLVGTPAYMAPEQHAGAGLAKVGAWTDQFAFAVSLYESLYGDLPFEGEFLDEVYWNIKSGKVTDPPRDTEVPSWVFRIITKALSSDPDERYPSMQALLLALRDDPTKRRRRVAMFAGVGALTLLGGFGVYQAVWGGDDEPQPCRGAADRLAGIWDDGARTSVRGALLATELPYAQDAADRVSATLDTYAAEWTEVRTSVCEATRVHAEQSEALLDVRMACLDQRISELGALVRVLGEADDSVAERAVTAAAGLARVEDCAVATADGINALPDDPAERDAVIEIKNRIAEVRALTMTGRFKKAAVLADTTTHMARDLDHPALLAASLWTEGRALQDAGNLDKARERFEESIANAASARDAVTETEAWRELIFVVGYLQGDVKSARAMRLAAEAAIERGGGSPRERVTLAMAMGSVETKASEFAAARQWFQQALDLSTQHLGPRDKKTAAALRNLAVVEYRLGDTETAIDSFERALDTTIEIFGDKHPEVAIAAFNLGNALSSTKPQRAEELYEKALRIREEVYGKRSVKVAQVLNSMGALQRKAEKRALARETYGRALEVFRDSGDPVSTAMTLNNLGLLESALGKPEAGAAHHEEALRILVDNVGKDHRSVGRTRMHLCKSNSAVGALADAQRECAAAIDVFEKVYKGPHEDIAETLETLAEIAQRRGDTATYQKRLEEALEARRKLGVTKP